jgi:hypothetical protein
MRVRWGEKAAFVAGTLVGLGIGGVALLTGVAMRRIGRGARSEPMRFIDREPDERERDLSLTMELASACEELPRLESELPEFSPRSQRW